MKLSPQLFVGKAPSRSLVDPIKNTMWIKPDGGIWTSSFNPEIGSSWVEFCRAEKYRHSRVRSWWKLYPRPARIYVVDSVASLNRLCERFPLRRSVAKVRGRTVRMIEEIVYKAIDFEAMAKKYDAMHLTEKGQHETRFSRPHSLYTWDVESTLWFRWSFSRVRKHAV